MDTMVCGTKRPHQNRSIKMTDLTLAICVYNKERYIEATLESVLRQTMQNFHLLIVDDCSTDRSINVIQTFFERHQYEYELVSFNENKGIGYARHFAERHAHTKYMMFMDSDDRLYPTAIEKMYKAIIADDDLVAVGCYLEHIDSKGKKIGSGIYLGSKTKEEFYEKAKNAKLIFMQATAVYNREQALSVGGYQIDGYPEGKPRYQDYCEDLDLWTRMSDLYKEGKAIIVLPEVLYQYRKTDGLSTSSYNMILKMRYVKQNLLRRRSGSKDITFCKFLESMTKKQLDNIKKDADAADSLRNGVFLLRKHSYAKGFLFIIRSIWLRPGYIIEKIRKNLLK